MSQKAYIITGFRSAVGKAGKGGFRFTRPDDLAADVIKHLMASVPQLDKNKVEDIINLSGAVNADVNPADQQAQEMANAEQPAA